MKFFDLVEWRKTTLCPTNTNVWLLRRYVVKWFRVNKNQEFFRTQDEQDMPVI